MVTGVSLSQAAAAAFDSALDVGQHKHIKRDNKLHWVQSGGIWTSLPLSIVSNVDYFKLGQSQAGGHKHSRSSLLQTLSKQMDMRLSQLCSM